MNEWANMIYAEALKIAKDTKTLGEDLKVCKAITTLESQGCYAFASALRQKLRERKHEIQNSTR